MKLRCACGNKLNGISSTTVCHLLCAINFQGKKEITTDCFLSLIPSPVLLLRTSAYHMLMISHPWPSFNKSYLFFCLTTYAFFFFFASIFDSVFGRKTLVVTKPIKENKGRRGRHNLFLLYVLST